MGILLKSKKVVNGAIRPIYAKGMTKSEYVVSVRDKGKQKLRDQRWKKENRTEYNAYMRNYMRKKAKVKKMYG